MMKKALLVLMTSGGLFGWGGCLSWKWLEDAAQFGFNVTGILDNLGVLTG